MSPSVTLDRPRPPRPAAPPTGDGPGERDGGGGGGGGGDGPGRDPGGEANWGSSGPPYSVARIGTIILIGSIVMLFSGFLSVYLILRYSAREWPPADQPRLPAGLWLSTAVIFASHFTMWLAGRGAAFGDLVRTRGQLVATFALGAAFCATQAVVWRHLLERGLGLASSTYASVFYCLTAVHFAHIVGGLVIFAAVLVALKRGGITPRNRERLANAALYWHFVGALWYVLFVALYLV